MLTAWQKALIAVAVIVAVALGLGLGLFFALRGEVDAETLPPAAVVTGASTPISTETPIAMFRIGVAAKLPSHPLFGQGSNFAFTINGEANPNLDLDPTQTYKFVMEASTAGHTFLLSTDVTGGSTAGMLSWWPRPLVPNETLDVAVPFACPTTPAYFVCGIHPDMGTGRAVSFAGC